MCMYQICSGIVYFLYACVYICIVCHVQLKQVQSVGHQGLGSIILLLTAQSAVLCCIGDRVLPEYIRVLLY